MEKVLLGMSGGVDSSVSAIILKDQGYDVYGATMNLFKENDLEDENSIDAKKVCDSLGINHCTLNFKDQFNNCVIRNFIEEYSNSRTPNPCVECNKHLKFGVMWEKAKELGMDFIATGHYAKVEYSDKYKRYVIKKADNLDKDQSYVLYGIPKDIIEHIKFPLGSFKSKDEIRSIAKEKGLSIASKSDSQDICFIPDGDYKSFLEKNSNLKGNIGNIIFNGKIIGKHTGLYKYTIGQRKGLGIAYEEPLYVVGFNNKNNELIVGVENDLYIKEFKVKNYNLLLVDSIDEPIKVNVKTRYKSKEFPALISMDNDYIKVEFDSPQKGITPGQSAVFYIDDIVFGGGIIV